MSFRTGGRKYPEKTQGSRETLPKGWARRMSHAILSLWPVVVVALFLALAAVFLVLWEQER